MAKTVVGLFDTRPMAEQAVQALVDSGITRDNVSVVANNNVDGTLDNVETTSGDSAATGAATGAVGGGVLGGALGLLVGIGALAIPGIGPVIAAGPIAAALGAAGTTALVGAGIGAVSGGLLGALVGAGIPEEDANYYAEGVRRGGTLVMAKVDDSMTGTAYNVMQQYGAADIDNRGTEWREGGWDRFDPEGNEWDRSSKVGTGTGTVAGAATGAAMGSVGGPIGTVIGGVAGAVTGAGVGAAGDAVGKEATENAGDDNRTSRRPMSSDIDTSVTTRGDTGMSATSTGTTGMTEPVMSDTNDKRPVGHTDSATTGRRGGRIYGDEGRYDWDDSTSTAVAVGAANYGGAAGSPSATSGVPAGGPVLAAAAMTDRDQTGDAHRHNVDAGDSPSEEWRESSKVGTGTGTVAGAATGAAMGSVGGPIGTVVGGVAGAVTGAVTGAAGDAAGEAAGDAARGDDDDTVVEREATNDVGGRKGQVKPTE